MAAAAAGDSIVKALLRGEHANSTTLVLQCVGVLQTKRFTMLALSDGQSWIKAFPASHIEEQAVDGAIAVGTRLRLRRFSLEDRGDMRMPHLSEVEVLDTVEIQGRPEKYEMRIPRSSCRAGLPAANADNQRELGGSLRAVQADNGQPGESGALPSGSQASGLGRPLEARPGVAADRVPNGNSHPDGINEECNGTRETEGASGNAFMSPVQTEAGRRPETPAAPQRPQPAGSRINMELVEAKGRSATPTRRRLDFGSSRVGALDMRPSDTAEAAAAAPQVARREPTSLREPGMALVKDLYPYIPNFRVKLKVLSRSEISPWENKNGSGTRAHWHFADAEGGEIGGVAWDEHANRLHPLLPPGTVAIISGGVIKPAFRGKGLDMTMQYTTAVIPCRGAVMMPRLRYEFVASIAAVETLEINSSTELIGIVSSVGMATTADTKFGRAIRKRSFTLADESFCMIEVTIWGQEADGIGEKLEQLFNTSTDSKPLLAVKGLRVGEYHGGVHMSASSNALFEIDPDHPRARQLREWEQRQGLAGLDASSFRNLSRDQGIGLNPMPRLTLEEALACDLGTQPSMYLMVNAVLTYVDYDCVYPACSKSSAASDAQQYRRAMYVQGKPRECQKKMRQDAEGLWYCETCCDRSEPKWRYKADAVFQDHTGQLKCIAFAQAGEQLLGVGADKYHEMLERAESREAAQALCQGQQGKRLMAKLRAAHHTWNNITSLQFTLVSLWPLDFRAESRKLLESIKEMGTASAV